MTNQCQNKLNSVKIIITSSSHSSQESLTYSSSSSSTALEFPLFICFVLTLTVQCFKYCNQFIIININKPSLLPLCCYYTSFVISNSHKRRTRRRNRWNTKTAKRNQYSSETKRISIVRLVKPIIIEFTIKLRRQRRRKDEDSEIGIKFKVVTEPKQKISLFFVMRYIVRCCC